MERLKIPVDALSVVILDPQRPESAIWQHRAEASVNPASLMKLVTTTAALDLLGPAFTWNTPVYVDGPIKDGVLQGNVYLRGQGDPRLVVERLWQLLRRVQGLGVRQIAGDIVLDRSACEVTETDPGSFDGEPLRPYNASPDALLLNFKSVSMTFVPDRGIRTAQVHFEPPLAGVDMQASVPLSNGECGDYRAALKADFANPARIRFAGTYPASCAEKTWSVAYVEPKTFGLRAIGGLWREMGGQLAGTVREGRVPSLANGNGNGAGPELLPEPVFELSSAPLAEIIRDINKYSNNVMAQQLFLTLSLAAPSPVPAPNGQRPAAGGTPRATEEASRAVLRRWWLERIGPEDVPVVMVLAELVVMVENMVDLGVVEAQEDDSLVLLQVVR
jgi:D-alanyl-D-alanine carboxypeptidase/D-alanyl-D-alanine-endopeptidase (penicillin-binding protein 4)